MRILLVLFFLSSFVWQSVIGELGITFVLLVWLQKQMSLSRVFFAAFFLGVLGDLLINHTLGMRSTLLLTYVLIVDLVSMRFEYHPFVISIINATSALVILIAALVLERGSFGPIFYWQSGLLLAIVFTMSLFWEMVQKQSGIVLRHRL